MSRRAAILVQADLDHAVAAFVKAGLVPVIEFDAESRRAIVRADNGKADKRPSWKDQAPDRV